MTEEDQVLVAKAALAGVRFRQDKTGDRYWHAEPGDNGIGRYTIGRAAMDGLFALRLISGHEHRDYLSTRGLDTGRGVDVDISVLAGCQPPTKEQP